MVLRTTYAWYPSPKLVLLLVYPRRRGQWCQCNYRRRLCRRRGWQYTPPMRLGAVFGVASGRGPLPGILSAGFIALFTASLGGTFVQCSGPTAPMTAVTITLVTAVMQNGKVDAECGDDMRCKDRFINLCLVLIGVCLVLCAVTRPGQVDHFRPQHRDLRLHEWHRCPDLVG